MLSNGLHGVRHGLDFPTATTGDGGIEYFHDERLVPGPAWLLEHYNAIQFDLLEHSRTHPPGPVLFYWLLWRLLREPVAISVAVCGASLALLLPKLKRLLNFMFGEEPPGAPLLFTLLPSVLIYGLATADASLPDRDSNSATHTTLSATPTSTARSPRRRARGSIRCEG